VTNAQIVQRLMMLPVALNPFYSESAYNALPPQHQATVQALAMGGAVSPSSMQPGGPSDHIMGLKSGTGVYGGSAGMAAPPSAQGILGSTATYGAPVLSPSAGGGPVDGPGVTPSPGNPGYEGWGNTGSVNPVAALRRKLWPVHILPASVLTDANGNGNLIFTPQEDFQAFLLTYPTSNGIQGYVTNIIVGTRTVNVTSLKTPLECMGEKNDARRFDFPVARTGQQIVVQIQGAPAATTVYAVLLGYGQGDTNQARQLARSPRSGFTGLGTTNINSGVTTTINVIPQERFKLRRLILNSQATNFGSLLIQSIQIGTRVESAQSTPYPAQVFSDLAIDDWVDFDVCPKVTTIAITVTNSNSSQTAVFEGGAVGDVWYEDEMYAAA
jgi:hypothetical protein